MVGEKEGMVIDVAGEEGRGPIMKTLKYFQQGRNNDQIWVLENLIALCRL